jgi:two-component system, cell cycle response regulator
MRILIAEDSDVYRRLLTAFLTRWGYEVECVTNGDDALSALLADDAPQLAILDWSMPRSSGIKVCRQLRSSGTKRYTYVLLLTGHTEPDDLVRAFEAGVDDFLTKPFDDRELQARLRAGGRIVTLQDNLASTFEALKHQACHDALTGTWNRAAIFDFLNRELARSRREECSPVSVIMADVDHFKNVNDCFGHQAGDKVLTQTAQRIRDIIRSCDGVGRYGGEEFLIVLPGCGIDDAIIRAEEIRSAVGGTPISHGPAPISITVSMGVATAKDSGDLVHLLTATDEALYRAKANGRNRVEVALQSDDSPILLPLENSRSRSTSGEDLWLRQYEFPILSREQ